MSILSLQKEQVQKTCNKGISPKCVSSFVREISTKVLGSSLIICLFSLALFSSHSVAAQTYGDNVVFGDMNQYSFDYTIVCSADGTTALLTVDFSAPPPGNVPQIHLGGGNFVGLTGPNPYTYTFTGLTGCDFFFQFWIAYEGGLYSSPFMDPTNTTSLPIELSSFFATKAGFKTTLLEWYTVSEINSDYFGVERSADGHNWQELHKVRAGGTSYRQLAYEYLDADIRFDNRAEVVFYYRLKMTDLDGTYEYSAISSVQFDNNTRQVAVYPNPAVDYINVNLSGVDQRANGEVVLTLYNDSGSEVLVRNVDKADQIDVTDLPSGAYYLVIQQGSETIHQASVTKVR